MFLIIALIIQQGWANGVCVVNTCFRLRYIPVFGRYITIRFSICSLSANFYILFIYNFLNCNFLHDLYTKGYLFGNFKIGSFS